MHVIKLPHHCSWLASDLMSDIFDAVEDGGCHTLAMSADGPGGRLAVAVTFDKEGKEVGVDPEGIEDIMFLLRLAVVVGGEAVIRTGSADGTARVFGWRILDFDTVPLPASQLAVTYRQFAPVTGEAGAGVEYVEAPALEA
ncbi:hypothetical protein ACFWUQ_27195 [Streptomyces sp. NPDC058662]|uniref:hypothetical protein n=1 Tax=Streptomyces sp. NPDC058662 TaxID=3346583 RepID=UPI00364EDB85